MESFRRLGPNTKIVYKDYDISVQCSRFSPLLKADKTDLNVGESFLMLFRHYLRINMFIAFKEHIQNKRTPLLRVRKTAPPPQLDRGETQLDSSGIIFDYTNMQIKITCVLYICIVDTSCTLFS
jgi:hypothetical protein